MLKFKEKVKKKINSEWDCYIFEQTEGTSIGDRYYWALAFDIYEFHGNWIDYCKTPNDIAFRKQKKIPQDFEVYKMKGQSKHFECKMVFLYHKDGILRFELKTGNKDIPEEQIVEYLNTIYTNHYYLKGFEDGYAKCENDVKEGYIYL